MKTIKKLFSFVCCLFLAVSCYAPFASASDPAKKAVVAPGGAVIGRVVEHTTVIEHTKVVEFVGVFSDVNAGRLPAVGDRATPVGDSSHCFFCVQADPNMYLTIRDPKNGAKTCAAPWSNDAWLTGWLRNSTRSYIFSIGRRPWDANVDPVFNRGMALDNALDPSTSIVHSWDAHGKDWQHWILVPVGGGYYIFQNFYTKLCLTYNPSNKQVTAATYVGSNCQHWMYQNWAIKFGKK